MKLVSEFPTQVLRSLGPGTVLNGIYEIDILIARGGMGEVYQGHVVDTGMKVAIKVLRAELLQHENAVALFKKEAVALSELNHEAIVRYYLLTTDPGTGARYIAMEFVQGESLSQIIDRGPLPLSDVRVLQRRLASALDVAHQAGITHRDLSPDNVVIPNGNPARAKVIDFGIARNTLSEGTVIGNSFAGKPNYASPEQMGLYGGEVGPRSDIYSLGLTLATALLGKPLDMGGTQVDLIRKRKVLPDLSQISPDIRPVLTAMLQPDPTQRPVSMAEVAAWRTEPSSWHPVTDTSVGKAPPPRQSRWFWPRLVGGALMVFLAGGGISYFATKQGQPLTSSPAASLDQPSKDRPAPTRTAAAPPAEDRLTLAEPRSLEPLPPALGVQAPVTPAAPPVSPPALTPATPAEPPPAPVVTAQIPASQPAVPSAGSDPGLRDCRDCPELVIVRGGVFRMGSNGDATERPTREVRVRPFMAGKTPVTNAQWRQCVTGGGCGSSMDGASDAPVHNLSWTDAQQYIGWLSRLTGRSYRLLSEAEWEYAARGDTTSAYWWGEGFRPDLAPCRGCGEPKRAPPAVMSYPPNPFGLYDMIGSVAQWTEDCWHKNYRGAPTTGSPWSEARCSERVLRGGSWMSERANLKLSTRASYDPSVRYVGHGFRVARDP